MATVATEAMTAEQFFDWVNRPENVDRFWELVDGEPVELSRPGQQHGSLMAWIGHLFWTFCRTRGGGQVVGGDAGVITKRRRDSVRGPDVALHLNPPRRLAINQRYTDVPADLVVEIRSPHDRDDDVIERIGEFLNLGVAVVWEVEPDELTVTVHRKDQSPTVLAVDDTLTGDLSLPGLEMPLRRLFQQILEVLAEQDDEA